MMVYVCTVLVAAIPLAVYMINRLLHKLGDPTWKSGGN